ncbi:MAG: demethoxyubiquinone hydroxylase family protein [Candidatus Brockarchaeota archaeon]|nr:demethoxyubiquinone hydroxylase family protein [Candidatus Brockarchaeota archaeon]
MSQTEAFPSLVPRKMSSEELARAIRQDIAAELDAINLYQAHIDATDDDRARKLLAHVRDEEKTHVGELLALLKVLDPDAQRLLEEGLEEAAPILKKGR